VRQARRLIVARRTDDHHRRGARAARRRDAARAGDRPHGNLRAPAVRVGDTLVVGFTADGLRAALG
jgi:hypothetical protein